MSHNNIVLGLDIGTTKICAVIAEYDHEQKSHEILGIGRTDSKGLKRGIVVNINETKTSIKQAISIAQAEANITTNEACIGIAGDHIHSLDHDAIVEIEHKDKIGLVIGEEDIENVLEKTKKFNLPPEREIIHTIPKNFIVDKENSCTNPLGMSGSTLSVSAHIIHALKNNVKNLKNCVNSTALNVSQVVLEPLASAEAVLSQEQKDLGVVLIDIGGGTSDIIIYQEGTLIFSGIIGYGG
ncbi:MAG: cell division protein FtsA, partial [Candidatus Marinimicrobia bacterium]|nr:cell division protein FtsA [Candidatus Neomarinimicrobiota bacterium]